MALERADAVLGSRDSSELTEQARELEQVVQRLLIAEQSEFAEEPASFGLTVPQYVTLSAIETFDGGRERMGKIADMARQCSATMTGIIDRLYRLSYLTSFLTGLKMVIPGCFVWISVFFVHFF